MADLDKTLELKLKDSVTPAAKGIASALQFVKGAAQGASEELNKYSDRLDNNARRQATYQRNVETWAKRQAILRANHLRDEQEIEKHQEAANRRAGVRTQEHVSNLDRITQAYNAVRYSAIAAGAAFAVHKVVDVARAAVELDNFAHKTRIAAQEIALMRKAGVAAGLSLQEVNSSIANATDKLIEMQKPVSKGIQELSKFRGGFELGQRIVAQMAKDGGKTANTVKLIAEWQAKGGDHAKRALSHVFGISYEFDKMYKIMGRMVQPTVLDPEKALELSIQWENAKTNLENMGTALAVKVMPHLTKMMENLNKPENVDKVANAVIGIAGAAENAAKALDGVAKAMGGWDVLINTIVAIKLGQWLFTVATGATAASTALWPLAAALGAVHAAYLLYKDITGQGEGQKKSGSWFGGIALPFGGAARSVLEPPATPGKATGGSVSGGSAYTVGERGRETFYPGQSGTIVPGSVQGQLAQQEMLREEQTANKTLDEIRDILEKQLEELELQGEELQGKEGGGGGGARRGGGGGAARRRGGGGGGARPAGTTETGTSDSQGGPAGPMGGGIPPSVAAQTDQAPPAAGGRRTASLQPGGGGGVEAPGPPGTGEAGGIPASIIEQARAVAVGKDGGMEGVRNFMARSKYPQSGAWCGKFAANVVLAAGGTPPKDPQIASNWRNFGTKVEGAPQPGDIAVAKPGWAPHRGSGRTGDIGSHVTIVDKSIDPKTGQFTGLGGNQGALRRGFQASRFDFYRGQVPASVAAAGTGKTRQPIPSPAKPAAVAQQIPPPSIVTPTPSAPAAGSIPPVPATGFSPEGYPETPSLTPSTSPSTVSAMVMGGHMVSGRPYLVGESGPETFWPDSPQAGRGVPANILAQAQQVAKSGKQGDVDKFMKAQGYPRSSAWCGKFMAASLTAAGGGYAVPQGYETASNWRNPETKRAPGEQQPGDIAVADVHRKTGKPVKTGEPGSHVTLFGGLDPDNPKNFLGTGGNQGGGAGSLKTSKFPASQYSFYAPPSVVGANGPETMVPNVSGQMMPNTNALDRALRAQAAPGLGGDLGTARLEIDVRGNAKTSYDTANSVFAETQLNRYPQMGQAYE